MGAESCQKNDKRSNDILLDKPISLFNKYSIAIGIMNNNHYQWLQKWLWNSEKTYEEQVNVCVYFLIV